MDSIQDNRVVAIGTAAAAGAITLAYLYRQQRLTSSPNRPTSSKPTATTSAFPDLTSREIVFTLPSGRSVSWAEYGDARTASRTILFLHGIPSSRIIPIPNLRATCQDAGVRIIAPDRPGSGHCSPAPRDQSIIHVATDDTLAILNHLRLLPPATTAPGNRRLEIAGFSGGGVFALALMRRLDPEHVRAMHLIAPGGFIGAPGAYDGIQAGNRMGHVLSRYAPGLLQAIYSMSVRMMATDSHITSTLKSAFEMEGEGSVLTDADLELWKINMWEAHRQEDSGCDGYTRSVLETFGKTAPFGFGFNVNEVRRIAQENDIEVTVHRAARDRMIAAACTEELARLVGVPKDDIQEYSLGHIGILKHVLVGLVQDADWDSRAVMGHSAFSMDMVSSVSDVVSIDDQSQSPYEQSPYDV